MKNIMYPLLAVLILILSCGRNYDKELLIAYGDSTGNVWLANEDGSDNRIIKSAGTAQPCRIENISFSADGDKISFTQNMGPYTSWKFLVIDLNGNTLYESAEETTPIVRPRWNVDTSYIIIKGTLGGSSGVGTYLLNWPTRDTVNLGAVPDNFMHATSISRESGYVISNDNPLNIFEYNFSTSTASGGWSIDSFALMISVSPDLSSIAFITGDASIKILDLASGLTRTIGVTTQSPQYISWSPDGSAIVFTTGTSSWIYFIEVSSGSLASWFDTGAGIIMSVGYQYKPI